MPSNKKRKKPANHSARGFATVSTPSRSKVDDGRVENSADPIAESETLGPNKVECNSPLESAVTGKLQKDLHELTAEELESHFEESNLQLLLEDHGEKCRKEASRQFNRVITEQRVLRPQSERLEVGFRLPDEYIQEILDLLKAQTNIDNLDNESVRVLTESDISESDLVVRLWTLEKILGRLGFKQDLIRLALTSLLRKRQFSQLITGKESIWGLDECFDILTLLCDPRDTPLYEYQPTDARPKINRIIEQGKRYEKYGNLPTAVASKQATQAGDSEADCKTDSVDEGSVTDSESETDEASEPETLICKYISLQSKILQLQPYFSFHQHKTSKFRHNEKNMHPIPKVARLLAKVQKIRADVLFDEDEASVRWLSLRERYALESAERKKYHLDPRIDDDSAAAVKLSSREASVVESGDDGEQFEMLGDLFSSLPEITSDPDKGASTLVNRDLVGQTVTIRDFGKWSGVNPRRVVEEACRARDTACKVTYNVVSESSFSCQHSLEIHWSISQDLPHLVHDSSIVSDVAEFNVTLQMKSVSTPDLLQSESYISTVALYLIFGHSPKEEKAYLRLPPQWRDLWKEMSLFEKKQNDVAERSVLRQLQDIITVTKSEDGIPQLPAGRSTEPKILKEYCPARDETTIKLPTGAEMTDKIAKLWSAKSSTSLYREMQKSRQKLPIWNFRDQLLEVIEDNQVVIICGETGCGKSTQVPAFILENQLSKNFHCKVYCTEPRRISAISLARRVSEELGEQRMDVGTSRSLVGYVIRLESKITNETRLVYATTGIVMRMLERSDGLGDITHLILDEVHERSLESDFLLIMLRKLMLRHPALKVILMSATVDAGRFSHYLGGAPIMNVPGRTFPVNTKYLEDAIEITDFSQEEESTRSFHIADYSDDDDDDKPESTGYQSASDNLKGYSAQTRNTLAGLDQYRIEYALIIKLLEVIAFEKQYVSFSKAVLIFLPGIAEIRRLSNLIQSHASFSQGWNICALHSTIATEEQERAFLVPLPGFRKIVLATNIAETGITIPDVTCVIDTGKHKEMRFDERRQLSRLIETFISRSNAKQRRGRAGRVQNGICFHLFTKARHDKLMLEEQRPEMLRLSLQDLVLRVKICKLGGIEETLSEALDPPSSKNIQRAINALVDAKALTTKEDLTPLGRQLARLPLDVFLGKLLVLGTFYQCLDAVLSIAAILSSKSPFSAPMGSRSQADVARLGFKKGDSDLLTVYNAYSAWRKICCTTGISEQLFCRKNYLSSQTLSNIEELKAQLMTSIVDAGFVNLDETEKSALNRVRLYSNKRRFIEIPERYMNNNANELMLNSVIAWSFYPKLLARDGKGWKNIVNNQHVSLHPTSVNKGLQQPARWLSYYHIMQSSNKFYNAHETSAVESMAVALGCGDADFKVYAGVIVIDGNRMRFAVNTWRAMLAIKTLRSQMRQIMAQFFRKPGCEFSPEQRAWMDIWQRVFTVEKGNA